MLDELPVPPEDRDVVAAFRSMARETFAKRAAQYDATGAFPRENYDDLKKAGLTALRVPRELGGLGVSSIAYLQILRALANADGAMALTFNMHSTVAFMVTHMGPTESRRAWGKRLAEGQIMAALGSEPFNNPHLPRNLASLDTTLVNKGDGYHLKTRKVWCSLGRYADLYVIYALADEARGMDDGLVLAVVEKGQQGVSFVDDWDSVGMRGTDSISIDFDCDVPRSHVVGAPGELLRSGHRAEYALGYCGTYFGIAEAAHEIAVSSAKSALKQALAPGRDRFNPDITRWITECGYVRGQLATMWIAAQHAASTTELGTDKRRMALLACKSIIAERAADLVQRSIRTTGAKAMYRKHGIERNYRDILAGILMAVRPEHGYYMLGYEELGVGKLLEGSG